MHLLWASEDFKLANRPRVGFPILLWEDMHSCLEANEFLRHYLTRGAIGSKKSWAPTGIALYDFYSFLEPHQLCWNDIDRGEDKNLVAAYRDYCFEIANLSRNTVRQRLIYICAFYEYAKRKSWIKKLPFEYEERRSMHRTDSFLQHVDAMGGATISRSVMPRKHKDLPKFLAKEQITALLGATSNPHHLMIIRMALQTGLRRGELASFPSAYVFDPNRTDSRDLNITITLDPADGTGMRTKGSYKRKIVISRRLMQVLYNYKIQRRGERGNLPKEDPQPLFLNHDGAPWAGDGKGIRDMVSKIGQKAGIKTHPHMLRHTYATHTLVALQRDRMSNRIEPIAFLQKQLGHASISTTMIYLHLINGLADEAVLAYDDELNDGMDESGTPSG